MARQVTKEENVVRLNQGSVKDADCAPRAMSSCAVCDGVFFVTYFKKICLVITGITKVSVSVVIVVIHGLRLG